MKRRTFITRTLLATGAISASGFLSACQKLSDKTVVKAAKRNKKFLPDLEFDLISKKDEVQILPGRKTEVYSYDFKVVKGRKDAVKKIPGSYLGPVIRVKRGEKVRVNYKNMLDEESIVHWHGLHIPEEMDGHPRYVIDGGEEYVYEFEIMNRAGTYWFHPHPHGKTGPQVYAGLAGLFIVSDREEESLNLPNGKYDIPLVIQDRTFDSDNQLVYLKNPMDRMMGFLGEQVLVNGKPDLKVSVSTRAYRVRLLNGSNSRIYKVALSNNKPLTVIGVDGGLLEKPVVKNYITLAPAERADLIIDFSGLELNEKIELVSLSFPDPNSGGGMMMGGSSGLRNGAPFKLVTFEINKVVSNSFKLPSRLSKIPAIDTRKAINKSNPRRFVFAMSRMSWTINGRTFGMTDVANDEIVKLNTTEIWEFINGGSMGMGMGMGMMGGMMKMPHPVHIHQLQFRIVERSYEDNALWRALKDGFLDEGWKDTFLLLPGMKVKVLISFKDYPGLFLYHCHNLEHEDMGMMRNYLIKT